MYISVKLLNGFKESLTYKVPPEWSEKDLEGTLVKVPLQNRYEYAYIERSFTQLPSNATYFVKDATEKDLLPCDTSYLPFLKKLSHYYASDVLSFLKRIRKFLQEKEKISTVLSSLQILDNDEETVLSTQLTKEQQTIVDAISPAISQGKYFPALIHGVTNSGKTEIYKKLILHAWAEGKGTLFLVPEVSLAVQFSRLLRVQLPHTIDLFSFHSATSVKEKKTLWHHLLANKPAVIIGVHLPLLLPISHLGLIIIDEEHDTGFQEKRHPKIHTKEAALLRAQSASIPVIAGSATPSISSLFNVHNKGWHLFELHKRYAGSFPTVSVVKLSDKKPRKNFFISNELEAALNEQLKKKEQAIIFLNRRGYSFFIQCKECGLIPTCINCSVSLTLHKDSILRCHYCSYAIPELSSCLGCKKSIFIKKGIGTQQVVAILQKLFPQARIERADLDTSVNKKKWTQIVADFEAGAIDILVGTQTITKGYHFPKVTLVGVLWADINLSIPFYNACETTLQQLIQVAGRAGRQSQDSRVIVQTMIEHPLFKYLNEVSYTKFYEDEVLKRNELHYPPCGRLAEIEMKHADESLLCKEVQRFADGLHKALSKNASDIIILGPSQPVVSKIQNLHSRKIYVKGKSMAAIIQLYRSINRKDFLSSCYFTPNPLS